MSPNTSQMHISGSASALGKRPPQKAERTGAASGALLETAKAYAKRTYAQADAEGVFDAAPARRSPTGSSLSSSRPLPLQTPEATRTLGGPKDTSLLRDSRLRRAADNVVNLLVLGGVIASFLTPVGHIALAVGLGLSLATSLPDWAGKQDGPDRKVAAMFLGISVALAFGSVMAVLAVGTGPVGWTLSALASTAMVGRFGMLMHANRGHGMRHAMKASLMEMLNIKPGTPSRAKAALPA